MEKYETGYGQAHFYAARVICFADWLIFTAFLMRISEQRKHETQPSAEQVLFSVSLI